MAGEVHLLELGPGPTPAMGVEVEVLRRGGLRVVHWLQGERFRVMALVERA
jgi:hypothetical protein